MRDLACCPRTKNQRSRTAVGGGGFHPGLPGRLSTASSRPGTVCLPARPGTRALQGQEFGWASRRAEGQGHFVRDSEPGTAHGGIAGQKGTARCRKAVVLRGLAKNRAEAAHLHCGGNLRVSLLVRRQPDREAHLLPARRMLRLDSERRLQIRQAAAFVFLADRERKALRPQFSVSHERGIGEGPW